MCGRRHREEFLRGDPKGARILAATVAGRKQDKGRKMISTRELGRNSLSIALIWLLGALLAAPAAAAAEPLRLHPDNPHYFLFRGKPTVLITSGEHYGAVLNLDFDYVAYLG